VQNAPLKERGFGVPVSNGRGGQSNHCIFQSCSTLLSAAICVSVTSSATSTADPKAFVGESIGPTRIGLTMLYVNR
jgi:hypothetical protein